LHTPETKSDNLWEDFMKMKLAAIFGALLLCATASAFGQDQSTASPDKPGVGDAMKGAAKTTGKDTKKGVTTAGKDTGKAVKTAGKDTGKGAEVAGKDTAKGTKVAAKDTGKAVDKTGKETGKVAEKTGSGVKKGVTGVGHKLKPKSDKPADAPAAADAPK
jgi:hypothetical protein